MKIRDFSKTLKPQPKVFGIDVYAWFPDGRVKKITPGDGIYVHPCIHPEGKEVLFNGGVSGPSRIYKADLATGQMALLTPSDSTADNAVFSWDGGKIVFCSDRASGREPAQVEDVVRFPPPVEGVINVFIMDSNGGNVQQVTSGPHQDQRPCLSPDGKTIVFVSNRAGDVSQFRLWSVPADASKKPRFLNSDVIAYRPWYSKDGELIYFFANINGRNQICKIPAEGGDFVPLANDDKGDSRGPYIDPNADVFAVYGYHISFRVNKSRQSIHYPAIYTNNSIEYQLFRPSP